MLLYTQGHGSKSERAARIGHDHAVVAGNPHLQAKLISDTAAALYLQGRIPEAAKAYQAAYELLDRLGDSADLAAALANLAFILDLQDRSQEAIAHYRKAEQLSLKLGDTAGRIIILNDLGFSLREWGRVRSSLEPLLESERLLAQTFGAIEDQRRNWAQLGESYFHLSDYTRSLDYLQRARALSAESNLPHGFIYLSLAKPYLALGQFELAGAQLEAAAHQPALRERIRGIIWLLKAKLLMWQNQPATAALAAAEPLLDLEHNKAGLSKFLILKAPALPPQTALLHAQRALDIADSLELGGHKIAAETRCAQALLALGRLHEARQHSASARYLMQGYQPLDFYEAEVHFTHYQILKALQDPAAPAQLEECLAWIMDVADSKVPPEYRRSFLTRNPVNKAVLEAVRMVAPERLEAPENLAPSAPARPLSERLGGLTEREAQVLRLVAAAMTDREIAGKLRISPATVSKHIANLLAKTSLHNRVELTRWALEHGFNQSKAQRQS
jgi:DNA-binding CsgD family transcriptional regulator/tetratricopeptide (TPR) repeat protein